MHGFGPFPLIHLLGGLLHLIVLFGGAFFLLQYYLKHSRKPEPVRVATDDNHLLVQLRLQAYERFVLFLERIHPAHLSMRLNNPELTAIQVQSLVVKTIREEFDYNLSQQLYISPGLWDVIKNAKEESISLINQVTSGLTEDAMSGDFVKAVYTETVSKGKLPVESALDAVKQELQRNFR